MISVCMILYNEEATLPMSMETAKLLADEIIVVDNGSNDRTVEIAKDFGATVLMNNDRSSKAALRNQAMAAATGDWIVILDGDEKVADPTGLRNRLQWSKSEVAFLKIVTPDRAGLSFHQMRCWKRGRYEYKYRSHEIPVACQTEKRGVVDYLDFELEHHQPGNRWPMKLETTLARLILDVHENPGDPRPLFYLGRQYSYLSNWKEAIRTLRKYFELAGRGDDIEAHLCLGRALANSGEAQKSREQYFRALALAPCRRDIWSQLADSFKLECRFDEAAAMLKAAKEMPIPTGGFIHNEYYEGPLLDDELARALWKAGRIKEGLDYATKALALDPDNERLQRNIKWFEDYLND